MLIPGVLVAPRCEFRRTPRYQTEDEWVLFGGISKLLSNVTATSLPYPGIVRRLGESEKGFSHFASLTSATGR